MTTEELARAVRSLSKAGAYLATGDHPDDDKEITKPLAALIEATDEYLRLQKQYGPAPYMKLKTALDAMVRAINGEGER